jgi:membrane associated rhomboid family serine protease
MHDAGRGFPLTLPPATRALLGVNLVVFAANALLFGRLSEPSAGAWLACSWPGLQEGYGLGLLRLCTYQFTHAFGDIMHLLMNMLALWVFGPMAEQRIGRRGLWWLYLAGGIAGAIGHLTIAAVQGSLAVPLVGASGACYALMVFAACAEPHARIVFVIVQMPLWGLAVLLSAIGVYQQFVELAAGHGGGVSHSAHIGGALLGFAAFRAGWFGDFLAIDGAGQPGMLQRWLAARSAASRQRAATAIAADAAAVDALLAKVKEQGLPSLTARERQVLARASERAQRR